eukprot:scaffold16800_cov58-Phaeocystis_antarctica.AAC.5
MRGRCECRLVALRCCMEEWCGRAGAALRSRGREPACAAGIGPQVRYAGAAMTGARRGAGGEGHALASKIVVGVRFSLWLVLQGWSQFGCATLVVSRTALGVTSTARVFDGATTRCFLETSVVLRKHRVVARTRLQCVIPGFVCEFRTATGSGS